MNNPKPRLLDPKRQLQHPRDPVSVLPRVLADVGEKGLMLMAVLGAFGSLTRAKVVAFIQGVTRCSGDGIELMIAHGGPSRSRIDHGSHHFQCSDLMRTAINEITNVNGGPFWMPPGAGSMTITHLLQQGLEPICMTMHVANYIVCERHDHYAPPLSQG
jgi:hypothetical protein